MNEEQKDIATSAATFNPDVSARLSAFLDSSPRHKFVFVKTPDSLADVPFVNVGFESASHLRDSDTADTKADFLQFIKKLIYDNISTHPQFGKFIYLRNIGALFEPELGLDVGLFLTNISRNTLLLLDWPGQIKYPYIYFLRTDSKHKMKIDNLNYTITSHPQLNIS